jgi:hypothetical protein
MKRMLGQAEAKHRGKSLLSKKHGWSKADKTMSDHMINHRTVTAALHHVTACSFCLAC